MNDEIQKRRLELLAKMPPQQKQDLYRKIISMQIGLTRMIIDEFGPDLDGELLECEGKQKLTEFLALAREQYDFLKPFSEQATLSDEDMVRIDAVSARQTAAMQAIEEFFQGDLTGAIKAMRSN